MDIATLSSASLYTYTTLQPRQIRLFKILSYDDRHDILNCTLSSVDLPETTSLGAYSALSYTWGEGPHNTPIQIDGSITRIPANLHNFLVQLFHYHQGVDENIANMASLLWADAICIDQSNTTEKSAQIPLMDYIFTSASRVFARLTSIPDDKASFCFGQGVARLLSLYPVAEEWERISLNEARGLSAAEGWEHISLKEQLGDIFGTFLELCCFLMLDEWISRVWTLQEYVLNTNVFFFISMFPSGHRKPNSLLIHGDFLNLILAKISRTEGFNELERYNFLRISSCWQDWMTMWLVRFQYWRGDFSTYSPAERLLRLYENAASRTCFVPHDHVYGMLGIVDLPQLPQELMPNYNTPFGDVFWQYTKYIIAETRDLRILQRAHNGLVGYPSWVPDLRFKGDMVNVNIYTPSPVTISGNGRRLTVQGSKLGTVLAILHPSGGQEEYLSNIQDTILTASARVKRRPATDIFQQWFHDFASSLTVLRPMEFEARFQSMGDILVEAKKGTSPQNGISILAKSMLERTAAAGWILLDNGDVLHVGERIASKISGIVSGAKTIWALKGSSGLSVLKSCENGYIYLGHCGRLRSTVLDDDFFSGRSIENVTLI
jgi:Heterokaryon incompatibility protein (HET)